MSGKKLAAGSSDRLSAAFRGQELVPTALGQIFALALATLLITALFASSASAAFTRQPTGATFGPAGTGAGTFEAVRSISVDPASGSIYVLDSAEGGSLYKFNSAGAPAQFSSLSTNVIKGVASAGEKEAEVAVAPPGSAGGTAGDIYIASFGAGVSVYGASGTKLGELNQAAACGVAVGPTGEVFVGSFSGGAASTNLVEYTPSANPPTNADLTAESAAGPEQICNVAAGPTGNIYAANYFENGVTKLVGIADPTPTLITPGGSAIAVDRMNGLLYLDRRNEIVLYDSSNAPDGKFGSGALAGSTAVAISSSSGAAYVADGATNRVEIYGPALTTPDVQVAAPAPITDSTATLHGTINPAEGPPATCEFQYVTKSAFAATGFTGAEVAPCSPSGPFTGNNDQQVEAEISGLERVTEYKVRLVATNANGTNSETADFTTSASPYGPEAPLGLCPANETFRVGPSARLPDCRAYEEASPVDKNGANVEGLGSILNVSPDGSTATYLSQAASLIPGSRGATQTFPTYLARLNGETWESQRLLPSQEKGEHAQYLGSTPDLRYAFVQAGNVDAGEALFEIDTVDGSEIQITPHLAGATQVFAFAGASTDGSMVFFESTSAVPVAASSAQPSSGVDNLYVWNRSTDEVTLAGVLPGATPEAPADGSFAGAYDWYSTENTERGGALAGLTVSALNAVSPEGDRAYFTSGRNAQIYLRRGLRSSSPSTVQVSAPESGVIDPFAPLPAAFQEATRDGSAAFFTSQEHLTADATTGPEDEGRDLYRWDANTEALVDIVPDPSEENGARVRGLLGVSENGKSGYFIARGVLATGAVAGRENLYRFEEDDTNHSFAITFIASLNEGGEQEVDRRNVSPRAEFQFSVSKTSRVTPDGDTLLFSSTARLTGYDNVSVSGSAGIDCNGGPCPELYRFSAATGSLNCVSCDPTGARPKGAASLQSVFIETFLVPGVEAQAPLSRNLSSDGKRIFFQTPDQLVAADKNGQKSCRPYNEGNATGPAYCQDVYEWEAPGTGSCSAAEVNGGCVSLLSAGTSDRASYFAGASDNGNRAFIITDSPLVRQDRDALNDLYAVTVNGGLASQNAPDVSVCLSESSCRQPSAGGSEILEPKTNVFEGPGNLRGQRPPTCKKRDHGHCRRHRRHRHHKKAKHKRPRSHTKQNQRRLGSHPEVVR